MKRSILTDIQPGVTGNDRDGNFRRAKFIALIYNLTGTLLSFAMFFFNNKISCILLLCYPLLGILIIRWGKGLIKFFFNRGRSVYASIIPGFFIPGFFLLIAAYKRFDIFQAHHIWLPALIIAGIIFIALYNAGIDRSTASDKKQAVAMLIFSLLYGFGTAVHINCVFDDSKPEIYRTAIIEHRVKQGKFTTYYLKLGAWGPGGQVKEVEINRQLYDITTVGDTINVNFRKGLINIPWFVVTTD